MDSYIVRIYRRSQTEPDELAGLVETVGTSERSSFRSFPELTSVLRNMFERRENDAFTKLQRTAEEAKPDRSNLNLIAGHKG